MKVHDVIIAESEESVRNECFIEADGIRIDTTDNFADSIGAATVYLSTLARIPGVEYTIVEETTVRSVHHPVLDKP